MEKITYKEFEKKVNKMGYQTYHTDNMMQVINEDAVIAMIYAKAEFRMNTTLNAFRFIRKEDMGNIGNLCWRLASTPLEDREESKKYHLRVKPRFRPWFVDGHDYLKRSRLCGTCWTSDNEDNNFQQTIFTEAEIEELRKSNDLALFERVEVDDEELA